MENDKTTAKPISLKEDILDTDDPYIPVPELKDQMDELWQSISMGVPITHQLKELVKKFPSYPQPVNLLSYVYSQRNKGKEGKELNGKALKDFPLSVETRLVHLRILLREEDYDAMEAFMDLSLPYEQQFPERKKVLITEYFDYEVLGIEWHLLNEETDKAIRRAHRLMPLLHKMDLGYLAENVLRIMDSYYDEDDPSPVLDHCLLSIERVIIGYPPLPDLHHPELSILYRELSADDAPALAALAKLPKTTLGADLNRIVVDALDETSFFAAGTNRDWDLILVGFVLLAEIGDQEGWTNWLRFLKYDEDTIKYWTGDFLLSHLFVVTYKLSHQEPARLVHEMLFDYDDHWIPVQFVMALWLIAVLDSTQKETVVKAFHESINKQFYLATETGDFNDTLLANLIIKACELDFSEFRNYISKAFGQNLIDIPVYGEEEQFTRELQEEGMALQEQVEYRIATMSLTDLLKDFFE
ncbi:DUF1186 domain-containing protein [Flavihumibacter rivuli]|uniref:tetratricopeptide repeat protein n=1 Tax=Flavihumibacter rivuli TaxID=2838156 RepID=UPI001BDED77C|nr:DUF1186 domain-containing protein [Flavihumibacter rivuli]ULQ55894.1 DUF1186 domain-containing protein [Flavihumibacter rivuli]